MTTLAPLRSAAPSDGHITRPANSRQADLTDRFREYRRTGDRGLRNELIEEHRWFAQMLAYRYRRTGEPVDDLVQVAMLGVLKAVERYDPNRGIDFTRFASVTVRGVLKRHFRDNTWSVKVSRTVRDLSIELRTTIDQLSQTLQRSPTVAEIADCAGVSIDRVLDALESSAAYRTASLDEGRQDGHGVVLERFLGRDDVRFEESDTSDQVRRLLQQLPERERRIVELRFFHDKIQGDIAHELGISQMHVSRLLARALGRLRILAGEPSALHGLTARRAAVETAQST